MSEAWHDPMPGRIEQQAAAWILAADRGLTPAEQDAFSAWLAADPRHGEEFARHKRHWRRLDGLAEWRPEHGARPNPDLLAPPLRRRVVRFVPWMTVLAAAAAIVLSFTFWSREIPPAGAATQAAMPASPNQRVLEDGTIVELNNDAALTVHYSPAERRVTLERGEAHFAVTKNEVRPFVVRAGGVDVRAVGTAFNVRVDAATVEVLVTEGRVQLETQPAAEAVAAGSASEPKPAPLPILEARQRAVVSLAAERVEPQIATLTAGEIERVLAWQHRLLDFTAAPLSQIVAEFNRRNVVQLVIIDPELAAERVTATFRSDNVEGFVNLLEAGFGARAEKRGEAEILLRKAN